MCLINKDTQGKAGLGVTERGSDSGTAERAPRRTTFIPPEREMWRMDSKRYNFGPR